MILWLIAPEFLGDDDALAEYQRGGKDDDRGAALLAEIEARELDTD